MQSQTYQPAQEGSPNNNANWVLIQRRSADNKSHLPDRWRRQIGCLVGENKNVAAFYRRLCTKFEYPPKLFPRIGQSVSSSRPRPNYRGPVNLSSYEVKWRDRQQFLESKGYMLRPRLRPGWTPSWLSTGQDYDSCEDSARLPHRPLLVDATRISDGKLVYIKEIRTGDLESSIALMLSAIDDPANHSVPVLDTFEDPVDQSISYLVMPFLRLTDNPPFEVIEELLDFVDQILEGLVFLHSHGVAHRDCSLKNILMDATHMYPLGFHPVDDIFLNDITTLAPVIPRLQAGVRYYFVDYGISSYFPAGSQRELVLGIAGRDQDVPELSNNVPYDPFKVDVFTVGNVLRLEFQTNYTNLGFFTPLIEHMTQTDPNNRPSAEQALQEWRTIRTRIYTLHRYWRLRNSNEPPLFGPVLDFFYLLGSIPRIFRLLGRKLRPPFA